MRDAWRIGEESNLPASPLPRQRTAAIDSHSSRSYLTRATGSVAAAAPQPQGHAMGLEEDIIKLLKSEGHRINEVIRDALDDFLTTVEEENEDMEDDLDEEAGGDDDED
jgi:hypothetical protein